MDPLQQILINGVISVMIVAIPLLAVWLRSRRKDVAETDKVRAEVASIWSDTYQEIIDNLRLELAGVRKELAEVKDEASRVKAEVQAVRKKSEGRLRVIQGLLEYIKEWERAVSLETSEVRERVAGRIKKRLPVEIDNEEYL